jgi:hypothetical protein
MGLFHSIPERMSGEKFHVIRGALTFSEEKVAFSSAPGAVTEGTFTIYGPAGASADGFVSSSNPAMQCLTAEFAGAADEIAWRFDASAYSQGETAEGCFRIISNQGEYRLPFSISIEIPEIASSMGPVKNLFHFTNLARANWDEALKLFSDPALESIFDTSHGSEEAELWRGLSCVPGNGQNMEEFLIAVNKKTAVQYIPEVETIKTELGIVLSGAGDPTRPIPYFFRLMRNGWGYTRIHVLADGDFLIPEKEWITQEDFQGSSCEIRYRIDPVKLHAGKNFGAILLKGAWTDLRVPVEAAASHYSADPWFQVRREYRQITAKITRYYEDYRAKKMSGREWLAQTGVLADRLATMDPDDPIAALYRIHLDITANRRREANWALADFDGRFRDPAEAEVRCYREYLGALAAGDGNALDTMDAANRVEEERKKDPSNWRIAWIAMYLCDKYSRHPSQKWELLQNLFRQGIRSPILYIESYQLVRTNPAVISSLDDFELQVLWNAAKKDILTPAVMTQVNQLTLRQKLFSGRLFRILERGYNAGILPEETLQSICTLLIRGNMESPDYFSWYEKGVEAQLSLTRLFEFYMLSLPQDFDGEIPQVVLLYFCYQCSLPFEKTARLYRYVGQHKDSYSDLYEHYLPDIRRFTLEQLEKRHVSKALCWLYQHFLDGGVLTRQNAALACEAAFTCVVHSNRPELGLRQVILRYDKVRSEQSFPARDDTCYLPIYGEDCHIFHADADGNRYYVSAPFIFERLMAYESLVPALAQFDTGLLGFDLYLTGLAGDSWQVTQENAARFRVLADSPELRENWRQEIRMKLLQYYSDNDCLRELDSWLEEIEPEELTAPERDGIIRYLVMRGLNDRALSWVERYGIHGMDASTMYRLISRSLSREMPTEEEMPAELVFGVFSENKYDENMLLYLENYFEGLTSEMEQIRAAAQNFGTDTWIILQRMVTQMLYSGVLLKNEEQIVADYAARGGSAETLSALLAQVSHYAFVDDVTFGQEIYRRIGDLGRAGEPVFDICRMAFLKQLSGVSGEMPADDLKAAKLFLGDLLSEDIVFPFYRSFAGLLPRLQEYSDQTMLQFKGRCGANVLFHYAVDRDSTAQEEYSILPMKEMYDGIYVTGLLLFFGEQVRYFITDDADQKNVVESGSFGQDTRIQDAGDDRFALINRISMFTALKKYDEALDVLEAYDRRAQMVAALFHRE